MEMTVNALGSGTKTNMYGLHLRSLFNSGGVVGNKYGIYLENFSGNATAKNYLIYGVPNVPSQMIGGMWFGPETPANATGRKLFVNGLVRLDNIGTGTDALGDMYYRNSSGNVTRLPIGTAGQSLTVTGGVPTWGTSSGGIQKRTLTFQPTAFNTNSTSGQSITGIVIPTEMAGWSIVSVDWRSFDPVTGGDVDVAVRKVTTAGSSSNLSGAVIVNGTRYTNQTFTAGLLLVAAGDLLQSNIIVPGTMNGLTVSITLQAP